MGPLRLDSDPRVGYVVFLDTFAEHLRYWILTFFVSMLQDKNIYNTSQDKRVTARLMIEKVLQLLTQKW